jgi:sugar lactone lactonase YvrE
MSNDGLLYVCDRGNQRIQVFKPDGTFVKDALINAKLSGGQIGGNPWDMAMSRDPQQRFIFLVDGGTHRVHTLLRDTLEVVSSFGQRGRWAGEFESPHSIAIDSKGNLYVAETLDGRRVQRFVRKGAAGRSSSGGPD